MKVACAIEGVKVIQMKVKHRTIYTEGCNNKSERIRSEKTIDEVTRGS